MSREWKPGDVAVICVPLKTQPGHSPDERGYGPMRAVHTSSGGWAALADVDYYWKKGYAFHDSSPRPLVVIDPEDEAAAFRLINLYFTGGADVHNARCMQRALREYVADPKPPRPDEPTGLGAVVEDMEGDRWVFTGDVDSGGSWWLNGSDPERWPTINAVRVLSEGVPQ